MSRTYRRVRKNVEGKLYFVKYGDVWDVAAWSQSFYALFFHKLGLPSFNPWKRHVDAMERLDYAPPAGSDSSDLTLVKEFYAEEEERPSAPFTVFHGRVLNAYRLRLATVTDEELRTANEDTLEEMGEAVAGQEQDPDSKFFIANFRQEVAPWFIDARNIKISCADTPDQDE